MDFRREPDVEKDEPVSAQSFSYISHRRLMWGVGVSLIFHALLLSLQMGMPGLFMPSFDLPWKERRASPIEVRLSTKGKEDALPSPSVTQSELFKMPNPSLPNPVPRLPSDLVEENQQKKITLHKKNFTRNYPLPVPPSLVIVNVPWLVQYETRMNNIQIIALDNLVDGGFFVPAYTEQDKNEQEIERKRKLHSKKIDEKYKDISLENNTEKNEEAENDIKEEKVLTTQVVEKRVEEMQEKETRIQETQQEEKIEVKWHELQKNLHQITENNELSLHKDFQNHEKIPFLKEQAGDHKQNEIKRSEQILLETAKREAIEDARREAEKRDWIAKETLRQAQLRQAELQHQQQLAREIELQEQQVLAKENAAKIKDNLNKAKNLSIENLKLESVNNVQTNNRNFELEQAQKRLNVLTVQEDAPEIRSEKIEKKIEIKSLENVKEIPLKDVSVDSNRELPNKDEAKNNSPIDKKTESTDMMKMKSQSNAAYTANFRKDNQSSHLSHGSATSAHAKSGVGGLSSKVSPQAQSDFDMAKSEENLTSQLKDQARTGNWMKAPQRSSKESKTNEDRRRSFLGVYDKEVPLRMYVDSLRQKLERNGNLIYEKKTTNGTEYYVVLNMVIRSDGTVEEVSVVKGSGVRALDERAVNMVKVNAPYATFPPALALKYDVIEIQRTWVFGDKLRILEVL